MASAAGLATIIGMNLTEFRQALADHPGAALRFVPAGGEAIAPHFHVTEIGRVEKQFVDCGGKPRSTVACVLQTLVAHDTDHRLMTDKLANIVALADRLDLPGDTPVEVEHQERSISVDAVDRFELSDGELVFHLAAKQTACLAEDACGLGLNPDGTVSKSGLGGLSLNVIGDSCETTDCSGDTGCC